MKKVLFLLICLLMSYSKMSAEKVLVSGLSVWTHSGEKGVFLLEADPTLTFIEGDVARLTAGRTSLLFKMTELEKLLLVEVEKEASGIERVENEPVRFDVRQDQLCVTNLAKGVCLEIFSIDGKMISQIAADETGMVQVKIDETMPKMLVVRAGTLTTKIVRK